MNKAVRKITRPKVRNLSGVAIDGWERSFIANEVESYLAMKNDCPILVISQVWDGTYELDGVRAVKEGYTVEEMILDLEKDLRFEGYSNQIWFVCQLSKSLKTIMVKEVRRQ